MVGNPAMNRMKRVFHQGFMTDSNGKVTGMVAPEFPEYIENRFNLGGREVITQVDGFKFSVCGRGMSHGKAIRRLRKLVSNYLLQKDRG